MNKCKHFDPELNICKLHSDWSSPMPVLNPCIESPCENYSPKEMPKEYIEREALKRTLIDKKGFYPAIVKEAIETAPAADVVEVVRCRDCVHYCPMDKQHKHVRYCYWHSRLSRDNGYCDEGVRKNKDD